MIEGYFTILKLLERKEELNPVLEKRVRKYAARLNLKHFSQFDVPITEMSVAEYESMKTRTVYL